MSRVTARADRSAAAAAAAAAAEKPLGKEGGFELIRKDRYLLLIAMLTVLLNVVNTSGEYLFGRYVVETGQRAAGGPVPELAAARERFIGQTYSQLFSTVNLVGFLLQMFVVSRVFKYLGVGKSLFIHPLVAAVGYLLMLRAPSLQLMRWLKVADNSLDYSLGNTTKQALWLPTSREAKYKAKQAVDSFFMRAGDVIQAASSSRASAWRSPCQGLRPSTSCSSARGSVWRDCFASRSAARLRSHGRQNCDP